MDPEQVVPLRWDIRAGSFPSAYVEGDTARALDGLILRRAVFAFLIIVGDAVVFVESKGGGPFRIYINDKRVDGLFSDVLHVWHHGNDGASPDKNRSEEHTSELQS